MMKGQCIPRFKSNSSENRNPSSPMSLLERFREAVLRLMMLSALSKATNHGGGSSNRGQRRRYYRNDTHHTEAVADCTEFIKEKAAADSGTPHSTAGRSVQSTAEVVVPLYCNT